MTLADGQRMSECISCSAERDVHQIVWVHIGCLEFGDGVMIDNVDLYRCLIIVLFFFFQAEDGIRDYKVTGVQTCALPIWVAAARARARDQRHAGVERVPVAGRARVERDVAVVELARQRSRQLAALVGGERSEERRVGEEGRSRGSPDHLKKKKEKKVEER